VKLILSAISLLVSIGFGVIGGSIAADPDTALIGAFGVLIVGYALASCVLLFRAWRSVREMAAARVSARSQLLRNLDHRIV
jgi:Na+-translocating ferredoxin:NAD+ oxidoreductase RnfD subunit